MAANFFSSVKRISPVVALELLLATLSLALTDASTASLTWGASVVCVGLALDVWTTGYGGSGIRRNLALAGPFLFIRYPALLARFLILFGLFITSSSPLLFSVAVLVLTPFYRRVAEMEDDWLKSALGPRAAEYRAVVSGFIPQLLPAKLVGLLHPSSNNKFSWSLVLKARSKRAILFLLSMFFLLQFFWTKRLISEWAWRWLAPCIAILSILFVLIRLGVGGLQPSASVDQS